MRISELIQRSQLVSSRGLVCIIVAFLIASIGAAFWPTSVDAIPAFARKYETSCQTCHVAYPKLTAFGEAFRLNGYQFPGDDEEFVVEEPIEMGAQAWKRVWPDAVWPGYLPGSLPLSLRVVGAFNFDTDRAAGESQSWANIPSAVNLLGSGTFDENISFWIGAHLFQNGEPGTVERAYLQFSDLIGELDEGRNMSVRIGKFEPDIAPFSSHRRLLLSDYLFNSYNIEQGSVIEAGHDHGGGFSFSNSVTGIELTGVLESRFEYVAGLVSSAPLRESHDNLLEDYYARVWWKFGGMGFNGAPSGAKKVGGTDGEGADSEDGEEGEGGDDDGDQSASKPMPWQDDSFRLGVFGYWGNDSTADSTVDDFSRVGFDARWMRGSMDLYGAYMEASDSPRDGDPDLDYDAWFLESDYVIYPWLIGSLRYEEVDPDGLDQITRWVPSVTILQRANIKWTIEAQIYPDDNGNGLVQIGFDFVF